LTEETCLPSENSARERDAETTPHLPARFNLGSEAKTVRANWSDFGLTGRKQVRDVWADQNLGRHKDGFEATIPSHGTKLLKVW
jgi:hypothetical protein